jgi:hypothetical protein
MSNNCELVNRLLFKDGCDTVPSSFTVTEYPCTCLGKEEKKGAVQVPNLEDLCEKRLSRLNGAFRMQCPIDL